MTDTPTVSNVVAGALDATSNTTPTLPTPVASDSASLLDMITGNNPYFQAGFGLMGVGVALTAFRQGAVMGTTALRRRMLVSLEINNKDPTYEWFLAWMAHHQKNAAAKSTSARWMRSHQLSVETLIERRKNGSASASFSLVAGPGTHYFNYQGAWMQVKRERETRAVQVVGGATTPWETVTLTTLSRDRNVFPALLAEARDMAMHSQEGKLVVHTAWGTEWRPFGQPRRKRPLQSVVLDDGVSEKIEHDIKAFLDRRKWYADRGIPYRRGYLLHGPPGSGKSSFIQSLAGSLSYDICVLNLSERGLGDDKLNHLLSNAPERSFVLIEDIDAAFNKRVQTSEDGYQSSVTFSGFLNALDGVASGEERIIFMTTNHLEQLDPALIRPGRVDLSMLIDDATPSQASRLFRQFYADHATLPTQSTGEVDMTPEELKTLDEQLREMIGKGREAGQALSMAALQGLFIRSGPREAVEGCRQLLTTKATS